MHKHIFRLVGIISAFMLALPLASHGKAASKEKHSFDFVLYMRDCNIARPVGETLTTIKGDRHFLFCQKNKKTYKCELGFPSGEKGVKGSEIIYDDNLDLSSLLYLNSNKGADVVFVNKAKSSATSATRLIDENGLSSKLCSGSYLTADEYDIIMKQK